MRLLLLATISFIVQLTTPLFTLFGHAFSWRDLILIAGGLFLVWKATKEIHHTVDHDDHKDSMVGTLQLTLGGAIFQILLLDLVFSIDSIITAVGMTDEIAIMYIAVIAAVAVMLIAATPLANFIAKNPTIVMLALGFLLMIGMTLIADGMGYHVPRGYIYAAMGFSALVEALNMLARRRRRRWSALSAPRLAGPAGTVSTDSTARGEAHRSHPFQDDDGRAVGSVFSDTFSERLGRNSTSKPSPIMLVNSPIGVECRCIGRIIDE